MNVERWILSTALVLLAVVATPATRAADPPQVMEPTSGRTQEVFYGEPVDRVYAPSIHSWQALDGQRLVLYVTPFRPYLITLSRRVNTLKWEDKIGFDNRSNYLDARFDRVYIDGFPYGISRIEKLTRDTAKSLLRKDKGKDQDKPIPETEEEPAQDS